MGEGINGLRNACTGCFDGDVLVFVEVDTSVLLGGVVGIAKQFLFEAHIATSRNVDSVSPDTVAESLARGGSVTPVGVAVPSIGGDRTIGAPLVTPCRRAARSGLGAGSVVESTSGSTLSTADRRSGRAGVVPAVPAEGESKICGGLGEVTYPFVGTAGVEAARC